MSDSPMVSVLVPICNTEKYLDQCLNSLENQSYQNLEIICLNDGSTDSSLDILKRHAKQDPRITIIDKPNSGYGDSMNKGLEAARGTYIAILESDDFMLSEAIEHLVDAAEQFGAEMVKANFDFYWSEPERQEFFEMFREEHCNKLTCPRDYGIYFFHQKPSIWSGLYRTDFLRGYGINFLPTPGANFQDTSFALKCIASANKAVYLHESVVAYRQDNENSSVHASNKVTSTNGECAEYERWLKHEYAQTATPEEVAHMVRVAHIIKYDLYMWTYIRLAPKYHLDFLERMKTEYDKAIKAGEFTLEDLPSWKRANLAAILRDPEDWERKYHDFPNLGKMGRALHYARVGSPAVLFDYAWATLTHAEG